MAAKSWVTRGTALLAACSLVVLTDVAGAQAGPARAGPARAHQPIGTTGADWPLYGANPANTRTSTAGPAKAAVSSLRSLWRFDAHDGDFTGTPVVAGGRVFVGSNGAS